MIALKQFLTENNQNENIKYALNLTEEIEKSNTEVTEVDGLFNYYCSRIYTDAENIVKINKNIFKFPKDLFIEQCECDMRNSRE